MDIQTETELKEALKLLEAGNPFDAYEITSRLFEHDLESKELNYTNRCCIFWIDISKRIKGIADPFEQGERILYEWKAFQSFISREKYCYAPALYSMQKGFFTNALEHYNKFLDEKDSLRRAENYKKAGICYKKLGNFENARYCLSEANSIYPNLAPVLAELADCYSLCGEDKYGKVLFREAFFIAPESIDIDFLDSELIKCLIDKTAAKGYSGRVLLNWIPVYGVLGGIFNVRRELNSQEVGRLKQSIYAMENEYKDPSCNTAILTPRLLNYYFWLVDHYVLTHENVTKINEVLLKIKILDSSIYEMYVK